ncbi:MAG: class F sortase [Acidimicrobiales bacterium]
MIGPTLARSDPVAIDIPAIAVTSSLQDLGLAPTGSIEVPLPGPRYNEAAWYDGSPTPGEVGPAIIEGHIDSAATGPSVFFRLGALVPGDGVDVTLADGTVAVFSVTGVRQYPKADFPTNVVYGNTDFAALRLVTCGGSFDHTTGHYLANTVVFASLQSSHPGAPPAVAPGSGPHG